jgi:hypothetical protein
MRTFSLFSLVLIPVKILTIISMSIFNVLNGIYKALHQICYIQDLFDPCPRYDIFVVQGSQDVEDFTIMLQLQNKQNKKPK